MTELNLSETQKPSVAVFTSTKRGLAHYTMQQWPYLLQRTKPIYITFAREEVDELVVSVVKPKNIQKLIDFTEQTSSILRIYNFCKKKQVKAALFQVSDRMRNNVLFFTSLIGILKTLNIKVGFILHEVLPYELEFVSIDDLYLLYKLSDEFFVANENEKYKLHTYFLRNKNSIHIINHGVYTMFDKQKYTHEDAQRKLKIKDKKMVTFFGQIRAHKKISTLVDAVNKLAKTRDDFVLYILSDLNLSSPKLIEYLNSVKNKSGHRIKVISRYLNSDKIEEYFKASNIIVLPYERVIQSGVLFLAIGFKKPVIITKAFYEADLISEKGLGYVLKNNNSEELKMALDTVLNNLDEAEKVGEQAYNYYTNLDSWRIGVEKVLQYLLPTVEKDPITK